MNRDQFWSLVEKVDREAGGEMEKKCELLEAELARLSLEEILDWDLHLQTLRGEANTHDVGGVAHLYGGGCSDDGFLDFRSCLVSCGRKLFEQVMRDADNLADYKGRSHLMHEGYQYVAHTVYERLTGRAIPYDSSMLSQRRETSGTPWKVEDLPRRFPRMAARYGL